MEIKEMTIEQLEERKAAIVAELDAPEADLDAFEAEARAIKEELEKRAADEAKRVEIRRAVAGGEGKVLESINIVEEKKEMTETEKRVQEFSESGRISIESRQLLSTGTIAKPTEVGGISGLAKVASDIVDDVHAFPLTGSGAWIAAYKATDAAAAAVTDGSAVAGTASTYNYVTINPAEWGVLDEISKQVAKLSPLDYEQAIEDSAVIALRAEARNKILAALADSSLCEAKTYALDHNFLRKLVLGFRSIDGKGVRKLYLNATDLATLGAVRGTNEKKALYEITFDDETCTSGKISEGGLATAFRVIDGLATGTQYYGQPGAIDMPMWGPYTVETDEGGDYFKRNMIGIRGLQTAGADLVAKNGMQKIANA